MNNKVLVLASNSFSGSSFIDYQLNQGFQVFGVSRSKEINPVFLPYTKNKNNVNFSFFNYDINNDLDKIMDLIKKEKISYIVNFVAQSMVAQSWDNPEHWYQTNTLSMVSFHNKLKNLDFLDKYIHISTPEVYGNCDGTIKENTNYSPNTPYATSRAAADMSLMNFYNAYEFPVVWTRAANVYGSYQQLYRIIPKAILMFIMQEKLSLHGGGTSIRSFIHIDDVSSATSLILDKSDIGEIYHISTKKVLSIKDLIILIAKQMNINYEDFVSIAPDRLGKDNAYLLESSKVKSLGWEDKISLENGISQNIKWVKDNFDILKNLPLDYIHKI